MKKFVVTCLLIIVTTVKAQEVIPGLIPRFYSIEAATDLPYPAEEAHEMALNGFDLSTLGPDSTTNIWSPKRNLIPNMALLENHAKVKFVDQLPSRSGQTRFTIQTQDGRELIIVLSKKIHNTLLRRNILSKLGFSTQPMSWVPNIEIGFANTIDRDLLKEEMKDKLLAGVDRWIKKEHELSFEIQDALVLTPESNIYNLALGIMPENVHQGRRLLRSPYVPLALVDTPESVNLMPWQAGRIVLNHIKLNHTQDIDTTYDTSWEDARWIGRKIGILNRADFEEIVQKSYYPKAVELLLIEKIISRRDDLMNLLQIDQEFAKIAFNPEVSLEKKLVKGEITQEFFDGYSSRFSYGDPESPFSASELGFFALSRVQSQLIDTAISKLNNLIGSADEKNYAELVEKIIEKKGPFFPMQAVGVPSFHANVILSRDIVTGSYMGTNNKVQLVDNFGLSMSAGYIAGIEGAPIPLTSKGAVNLNFQRVFSHVKPIQSLKKSMKEPFRNLMVPLILGKIAHKIDKLSTVTGDTQTAMVGTILSDLKNSLSVGESFIITDSLVPSLFAEATLSISQFFLLDPALLKAYGRVQSERAMLTRFHLHRPDENTFQIYQDYGKDLKLMLTLKLKSYVPIIEFNARWNKVTAETHFYPITMSPRNVSVELLKALRQSILSLNHHALREIIRPHKIEHQVKERANTWELLIFKRNKIGDNQTIVAKHAKGGEEKKIYRRYDALTTGRDFESYATEAINNIISIFIKKDYSLNQVPTLNPGFTLFGRARNKIFTSEFDGRRMSTNFQRIFNGWKVKPKKMLKFIRLINEEAGELVFDPLSVINTKSILLYQMQFNYVLTQEGTDRLLNVSFEKLKDAFKHYGQYQIEEEKLDDLTTGYLNDLVRVKKNLKGSDPTKGMKLYHRWLKSLQEVITIKGLKEIVGKDNIAYQGRIDGFRQGDENGDNPIFSHVYGELPLMLQPSPTQSLMQNLGIIEGELLLNWMLERAI